MAFNKGITAVLFLILFSFSFTPDSKQVTIKGELKNIEGSEIYIFEYFGSELVPFDTTTHTNGAFEFSYDSPLPKGFYRIGTGPEKSFLIILGDESLSLSGDLKASEGQISNSTENSIYQKYLEYSQAHNQLFKNLQNKARQIQNTYGNNQEEFNSRINEVNRQADSANTAQTARMKALAADAEGKFVEKFIKMFLFGDKENFFSSAELTDPEYSRGDMLEHKLNLYLNRFFETEQWPDAAEELISKAPASSRNREAIYIGSIKVIYQQDQAAAYYLAQDYVKEFPESPHAQRLSGLIPAPPPQVGVHAPDFTVTGPEGEEKSLSSLKGKVVLLDFWASWCGPCRKENPNVVKAYNKYKDDGFTVFSVSLDQNKQRWIDAIESDNLAWDNHGSDLKGWSSSVAKLYGVNSIPNTFLIDPDGKIIGVNLRGPALEQKLEELFSE